MDISRRKFIVTGAVVALGATPLAFNYAAGAQTRTPSAGGVRAVDLSDPVKKEYAMEIVSSAENSSLNWKAQYGYIQDIHDKRGYTAGIIGFCSGTGDMLALVEYYTQVKPNNVLAQFLPTLRAINNSDSHGDLDKRGFTGKWKEAAKDKVFQQAQEHERDRSYFNPAVELGKKDGIRALGQFAYYDAAVVHGYAGDPSFPGGLVAIRERAVKRVKPPSQGGNETTYLNAFLDERVKEMKKESAHEDVSRIETAQRVFLKNGNFDLNAPLKWKVYGESFSINK